MLKFSLIENSGISTNDFRPFVKNNEIEFPKNEEIVAIYGPNGAGKTSFIKVLGGAKGTKVKFEYNGTPYISGEGIFHVINDQNNRNIIVGEAKDFFLGDNIKREFELQKYLDDERLKIIGEIITKLKVNYSISAASSPLLLLITDSEISEILKDIVNTKSKGAKFSTEDIIGKFAALPLINVTLDEKKQAKLNFLKSDLTSKDSIIMQIERMGTQTLQSNPQIHEIEENTEAISILNRFQKDQCIVCDTTDIDWQALLTAKTDNRTNVVNALGKDVQLLIEKIIRLVQNDDPFKIKEMLIEAICKGKNCNIDALIADFRIIKDIFNRLVLNELATVFVGSDLPAKVEEYQSLIAEKPEITEEDMLYIIFISKKCNGSITSKASEHRENRLSLAFGVLSISHALVGIDVYEVPVWMMFVKIHIVIFLKLI